MLSYMMAVLMANVFKYIMLGMSVSVCAYFLPSGLRSDVRSIIYIGLISAATYFILDTFSPKVGESARVGSGLGIGLNLVGAGQMMPVAVLGAAGAM